MEYLDGVELGRVIHGGEIDLIRALAIARQIAEALGAAHEQGIVHRDLKPENVLLVERDGDPDFVKVLDFGIALTADGAEPERRLTQPGLAMGTPEYMAPEQALALTTDARSDIYSLGAILYEMTTGQQPYRADTFTKVLVQKASSEPAPPREVRAELPEEVEALILKAMARDPAARHQSMSELAYDITRCLEGRDIAVSRVLGMTPAARTVTPPPRGPRDSASEAEPLGDELSATTSVDEAPEIPAPLLVPSQSHIDDEWSSLLTDLEMHAAKPESVPASAEALPSEPPLPPVETTGKDAEAAPARVRTPRRRRRARSVVVLPVLLAASGAGVYWYLARSSPPDAPTSATVRAGQAAERDLAEKPDERESATETASVSAAPSVRNTIRTAAAVPAREATKPRSTEASVGGPPPKSIAQARGILKTALDAVEHRQWATASSLYGRIAKGRYLKEWGHIGLARVALATGKTNEASRHGSAALRLGGGIPARMVLAAALAKQGQTASAIKQYRQVLRAEPGNKQAKREYAKLIAAQRRRK